MPGERDRILYVTLDEADYFAPGDARAAGHRPNFERLAAIAASEGITVSPVYMADLSDDRLSDPRLLALFGAGSFPEWNWQAADRQWAERLERYAHCLRSTRIPMLAVCGSHQFVAAAFSGWEAVGHMTAGGKPASTIADELRAGKSLIPCPRPGEVGIFPLRVQEPDPILAGLPDRLRFVQYHRDMVLPDRYSGFRSLLSPDTTEEPAFWLAGQQGHHDPLPEERCPVQLLRLATPDRLLYTAQFHPELPSGDPAVDTCGERLMKNFLRLAQAFWDNHS